MLNISNLIIGDITIVMKTISIIKILSSAMSDHIISHIIINVALLLYWLLPIADCLYIRYES